MPVAEIRLEGFAELQRALKAAGADAEQEFREELKNSSVVYKMAANARVRLKTSTGKNLARPSRSTGRAASSIRVGSTAKGVYIAGGKGTVPYYGWLDFGGVLQPKGKRKNRQHRPVLKKGRALYPAINMHRSELAGVAREAMDNASQKAGLHG